MLSLIRPCFLGDKSTGMDMATIVARKRKSGTVYQVKIRVKGYSESETFTNKTLAKTWALKRESTLRAPGGLDNVNKIEEGITLGKVLEWYREDFDGASKFGRAMLLDLPASGEIYR